MKINNYELIEIRDRLNTCYEYLRSRGIVHTQQDIADKMGSKKHSVSRAFNAVPEYLTENFLERFATSFSINYKWLRHGEGNMIDSENKQLTEDYIKYARPLIMGELTPIYTDGLPTHLIRK